MGYVAFLRLSLAQECTATNILFSLSKKLLSLTQMGYNIHTSKKIG